MLFFSAATVRKGAEPTKLAQPQTVKGIGDLEAALQSLS